MPCVIFDIDGTLANSYDLDSECFKKAVTDILGEVSYRDDWGDYPFVTDEGILQQVYSDNSLVFEHSGEVSSRFGELLARRLSLEPNSCVEIAGATRLVEDLRKDSNFRIGFATGGWRRTALLKLDHIGIGLSGDPLLSSDDHYARVEIMELCRTKIGSPPSEVVYVGDGEWDLRATRNLGWRFVGVGSRLKGKSPVWIPDFDSCDFPSLVHALRDS